jgi:hypothetical protein
MSAPVSHHPLVVNTADGSCWTRRAVSRDGRGWYALAGSVAGVPDEVLVSLADLAELGIVGSAFALPVPVGAPSFPPPRTELEQLRSQVAELLAERHSTNEALDDAVQALRANRDEISELTAGVAWRDAERDRWADVHSLVERAIDKGWSAVDTIDLEDALGPEAAAPSQAASKDEPAESEPPRIRKHHPDCAAVHQSGAPCTCPPDFTGEDPDDLVNEDEDGCTCPDTGRGEPHDVDCPLADEPGPYDTVVPAVGPGSSEMRELRAALTGAPDAITQRIAPLQALREDPHDSPLHHNWRLGRDLPEMGGA